MKRQIEKIMTMAVAAGLMTSMLCGEVSHAAKVKTPYYKTGVKTDYLVKDTAFYKKTGEVLSFRENVKLFLFGGGKKEVAQLEQWQQAYPRVVSVAGKCFRIFLHG